MYLSAALSEAQPLFSESFPNQSKVDLSWLIFFLNCINSAIPYCKHILIHITIFIWL